MNGKHLFKSFPGSEALLCVRPLLSVIQESCKNDEVMTLVCLQNDEVMTLVCLLMLLLGATNKRKDKHSNWFSDFPVKEWPIMKQIMFGRNSVASSVISMCVQSSATLQECSKASILHYLPVFKSILCYLQVCSLDSRSTGDAYDPVHEASELKDCLEQ